MSDRRQPDDRVAATLAGAAQEAQAVGDVRNPPSAFIRPCEPTLTDRPPAGPGWLHEIKHDGFRILARKQGERVQVWSRRGADFTYRFPAIAEAVRGLKVDRAFAPALNGAGRGLVMRDAQSANRNMVVKTAKTATNVKSRSCRSSSRSSLT